MDQVAFSVGGSHCKWQPVAHVRHTPEVPFTDVQKAHADTHIHEYTQSHDTSLSLRHLHRYCRTDIRNSTDRKKHTHAYTHTQTHTQTLGTDFIKDQNEARWDLAERHGMFFGHWSLIVKPLNQLSHRCPPLWHQQYQYQPVTLPYSVVLRGRHFVWLDPSWPVQWQRQYYLRPPQFSGPQR